MTNPSEIPPLTDAASLPPVVPRSHATRSAGDLLFWSIVLGGVLADFISKRMVESALVPHLPRPIIGEWVRFTLIYNPGAAMNLSFGDASRVVFSVIAAVMFVVIFRMLLQTRREDRWQAVALALIASGAIGNLVDRMRSARGVVDFIDVGIGASRFYTFNVADSMVSVGAVLLAILLWRHPEPTE
jgi:signal peptidase II